VLRRGRRPSSGESAAVPSVRPTVSPWCTAHRPRSTGRGPSARDFLLGNNSLFRDISEILQRGPRTLVKSTRGPDLIGFALRPSGFSEINPRSGIIVVRPGKLKNNSKKVHSLRKILQNSPKTSKIHIFSTTTPNLVILAPKFSGSLSLSFCAFI
jgi:hypothetical protein